MSEKLEEELKSLIVRRLMLDDVEPESIQSEGPLFGEGLGLDSIDALEIAMGVAEEFGVELRADDEQNRKIFFSVRTLAKHIAAQIDGANVGSQTNPE